MLLRINWLLPKLWFKGLIFVCMPYNKKHSTQRCSNTSYVERPLIQYDKPTQEACFLVRLGLNLDLERREQSNHFYTILIYKWNTYVIFSVTHISQFPKYQKVIINEVKLNMFLFLLIGRNNTTKDEMHTIIFILKLHSWWIRHVITTKEIWKYLITIFV